MTTAHCLLQEPSSHVYIYSVDKTIGVEDNSPKNKAHYIDKGYIIERGARVLATRLQER
jgi:hypothetical protein